MSVLHAAGATCFLGGVAVVVLASLASLRVRRPQDRLHFLTPATTLGTPLAGLGISLVNGWSLTTAQVLVTCGLVAITGPVLASAAMRIASMRAGEVTRESPE